MFRLDSDSSGTVSFEEFVIMIAYKIGKLYVQKTLRRNEPTKDAYAQSNYEWIIKKDHCVVIRHINK